MSGNLTVGRVTLSQPSIGPGNDPMCARCIVKHEQDLNRQIVKLLRAKSFPHEIINGKSEWTEIIDLLKLWETQYGK